MSEARRVLQSVDEDLSLGEFWGKKKDDSQEFETKESLFRAVEDSGLQFYYALDRAAQALQATNSKVAGFFRHGAKAVNHVLTTVDDIRNKIGATDAVPYYLKHK